MTTRLKLAAKVVASNSILLFLLLVALELRFGTWVRAMGLADLRSFAIPVNAKFVFDVSTLYAGGSTARYTRDEWGLRGSYQTPHDIDVLTVGGSTTDQRYIDDALTWQSIAQRELASNGLSVMFANAGVDGQSTTGHIFDFEYWFPMVPGLKPSSVVLYIGVNDTLSHVWDGYFSAPEDRQSWRRRSALYNLFRSVNGTARARLLGVAHQRRALSPPDFSSEGLLRDSQRQEISAIATKKFLANVETLTHQVRAMGATPVFVTQSAAAWNADSSLPPAGLRTSVTLLNETANYVDVSAVHRTLNVELMSFCKQRRLTCFDLARDVKFNSDDYYDMVHNTPKGAYKIGSYLAVQMRHAKLFDHRN